MHASTNWTEHDDDDLTEVADREDRPRNLGTGDGSELRTVHQTLGSADLHLRAPSSLPAAA